MREIHPSVMPLSDQIGYLAVVATVSAWMAWLWTHEEIFKDIQDFLKAKVKKHKDKMKAEYHGGNYRHMLRHWAIQKVCFGLTCQTCVVHYPTLTFIGIGGYRLITTGPVGFLYAWMFAAFTGDSVLWLLTIMRKRQRLEDQAARAVEAGATLLERKVDKDETSDVVPASGGGTTPAPTQVSRIVDGTGVGMRANGPTI